MKLNRSQLKSILKECIQELLVDGSFNKVISEALNNNGNNVTGGAPRKKNTETNKEDVRRRLSAMVNGNILEDSGMMLEGTVFPGYNEDDDGSNIILTEETRMVSSQVSDMISNGDSAMKNVFQGIFEDTAKTTLRSQQRGESNPGFERQAPDVDLNQVKPKDQNIGHWAALAFGNKNSK